MHTTPSISQQPCGLSRHTSTNTTAFVACGTAAPATAHRPSISTAAWALRHTSTQSYPGAANAHNPKHLTIAVWAAPPHKHTAALANLRHTHKYTATITRRSKCTQAKAFLQPCRLFGHTNTQQRWPTRATHKCTVAILRRSKCTQREAAQQPCLLNRHTHRRTGGLPRQQSKHKHKPYPGATYTHTLPASVRSGRRPDWLHP